MILENVLGLEQVMEELMALLRGVGAYNICTLKINPLNFGMPVDRCRFYILLLHKDILPASATEETTKEVIKRAVAVMERTSEFSFQLIMFSPTHPAVKDHLKMPCHLHLQR